jgi:predicted GNAT family acetyltransferase
MNRIELIRENHTAVLDYTIEAGTLSIWHVEVPPPLRGRGIAGELVDQARTLANEQQLAINPICSFAKSYLRRYKPLVTDEI